MNVIALLLAVANTDLLTNSFVSIYSVSLIQIPFTIYVNLKFHIATEYGTETPDCFSPPCFRPHPKTAKCLACDTIWLLITFGLVTLPHGTLVVLCCKAIYHFVANIYVAKHFSMWDYIPYEIPNLELNTPVPQLRYIGS